jgi:hypothetical protein
MHGKSIADLVYASAEGRTMGSLEEWTVHCGDCEDAWEAEQERGVSDSGAQRRHTSHLDQAVTMQ